MFPFFHGMIVLYFDVSKQILGVTTEHGFGGNCINLFRTILLCKNTCAIEIASISGSNCSAEWKDLLHSLFVLFPLFV